MFVRASSVPASLSQELTRVLIEMKRHPQGRTLIELFGIDGFAPADAPALERVVKALETT